MNIEYIGKSPRDGHEYSESDFARFFKALEWQDNGCLYWLRGCNSDGYGATSKRSKQMRANRVFYDIFNGPLVDGEVICHSCDNRQCVNPDHLWSGTLTDNNRDRSIKKRSRDQTGTKNNQAKLDDSKVFTILNLVACGMLHREAADIFGVTQTMVSRISRGESWQHVDNLGYKLVEKPPKNDNGSTSLEIADLIEEQL